MTVEEIYQVFSQNILENVPEDYVQAFARFERPGAGMLTGGGYFIRSNGHVGFYPHITKPSKNRRVMSALEMIWQMTHATGHYDWSVLYFGIKPDGTFKVEFEQEDLPTHPGYFNRLLQLITRPQVSLTMAEVTQQQTRLTALSRTITKEIAKTISSVENPWDETVLELTRTSVGAFQLRTQVAQPQLVPSDDTDPTWAAIDVTRNYPLFRNLVELTTLTGLGAWQHASIRVYVDGRYQLTFDNRQATGSKPSPAGIFPLQRQGFWL